MFQESFENVWPQAPSLHVVVFLTYLDTETPLDETSVTSNQQVTYR